MLQGLLSFLFALMCIFLVLIILIQKGKSSLGIYSLSSNAQAMFGGGGGQNIFQKATWVLGAILLFGSLGLSTTKYKQMRTKNYNQSSLPVSTN